MNGVSCEERKQKETKVHASVILYGDFFLFHCFLFFFSERTSRGCQGNNETGNGTLV